MLPRAILIYMGLFVQQDKRSELQEKIAADLRAKAQQSVGKGDEPLDEIADSKYMEGTKQTTTLAWAWTSIVFMAIGVIVLFVMQGQ